jgi:hypothetical protein
MAQFLGCWKLDRNSYTNFDEFCKVSGIYFFLLLIIFHICNYKNLYIMANTNDVYITLLNAVIFHW